MSPYRHRLLPVKLELLRGKIATSAAGGSRLDEVGRSRSWEAVFGRGTVDSYESFGSRVMHEAARFKRGKRGKRGSAGTGSGEAEHERRPVQRGTRFPPSGANDEASAVAAQTCRRNCPQPQIWVEIRPRRASASPLAPLAGKINAPRPSRLSVSTAGGQSSTPGGTWARGEAGAHEGLRPSVAGRRARVRR